ncbi:MAG: tetratricopeptide repeat protein [Hyphomonadaceae bacterium]
MRVRAALIAASVSALAFAIAPSVSANGGGSGAMGGGGQMSTGNSGSNPARAYQLGAAAYEAGNYAEAIRQFRIVQRAARNDANVNFALGLAYVGANDHEGAREPLERAVRQDNAPAGAYSNLGLVYLQLNRRDDAVTQQTALQDAINECDAECGDARRAQLQSAYDTLTRALAPPEAAPAAADPATTGWNFPDVEEGRLAYAAAVGMINGERYADALAALALAEEAIGPHPDILNYQGFASRKLGRLDVALGYYTEALALDPEHLGVNEYLGELYIQMGRMDDARRQLARLDELCAYGCAQREELARWIQLASN